MRKIKLVAYAIVLPFLFVGCKKPLNDGDVPQTALVNSASLSREDGPTVLGERYNNPYTPANMLAAKLHLESQGVFPSGTLNVRKTHLYVKFSPGNEEELMELAKDTTLNLDEYPANYEVLVTGNWYRESGLAEDVPTPQYATVPANYSFDPKISYSILEELYLPEEDELLMGTYIEDDQIYLTDLIIRAFDQVGAPHHLVPHTPYRNLDYGGGGGSGPNGRIEIFDTRLNRNIPMEGVKVTARRWHVTHKGYTDVNGDYWLNGSFNNPANYTILFERSGFTIGKNRLQRAKIVRTDIPGNTWSHTINSGLDRMHGHMFRGAYRYFFKDIAGLRRPYLNNGWQVAIVSQDNDGHYWGAGVNAGLFPYLFITRNKNGVENGSDEIFSTTVHELAHSTHILALKVGAISYLQVNGIIRESWAVGVEWLITGMEYREHGILDYGEVTFNPTPAISYPNQRAFQNWNSAISDKYTSLFINLVDDVNELNVNFGNINNPVMGSVNDQVRNYSLSTIESSMLKNVKDLSTLSTQLKANKPAGVTDGQIDLLISSY